MTSQQQQFFDHLHRGGAYAYYWYLDEEKTYTNKHTGEQEPCKRTAWRNVGKLGNAQPLKTEHAYFGVHPVVAIPQRTTKTGSKLILNGCAPKLKILPQSIVCLRSGTLKITRTAKRAR